MQGNGVLKIQAEPALSCCSLRDRNSKDSRFRKLLDDAGISPMKALLEKLTIYNDLNSPISTCICP